MANPPEESADKCPVDHETRAAWLKANPSMATFPGATPKADSSRASHGSSSDSSQIDQPPSPPAKKGWFSGFFSSPSAEPQQAVPSILSVEREISTIPRASAINTNPEGKAANSEKEGGVSESGNWIYPSERMFFEAMSRKGFQTEAENMRTIVPIHNAVNERAWKEIKEWEKPWGADEKYIKLWSIAIALANLITGVVDRNWTLSWDYLPRCRPEQDSIH